MAIFPGKNRTLCLTAIGLTAVAQTLFAADNPVSVTIDPAAGRTPISPYIYGTNQDISGTPFTAFRYGGNRTTGYNWENNASNAGSDYLHQSDDYLTWAAGIPANQANTPGIAITNFQDHALARTVPYSIVTLQLAGYVAKDKSGPVSVGETAPSNRWTAVSFIKPSALSLVPDTSDDFVYMDEFVNFLVNHYGAAGSANGIKGYNLDNEPDLWSSTHPRIHPNQPTCAELIARNVGAARAVKRVDPAAETFGFVSYGFNGYYSFQDAPDWAAAKASGGYRWFVDYYLDQMKKQSDSAGARLLDVLDLHNYSEHVAGGERVNNPSTWTNTDCNKGRMQAPRSLWDPTFVENSWIGQYFPGFLPFIPNVRASINSYYPGTKLAFTEYNFGGESHISGGIAEADTLGIFGRQGVYLASWWQLHDTPTYIAAAFKLYRDYDGAGGKFGNTTVSASNSDVVNCSVYASVDPADESKLHVVLLNKSYDQPAAFSFQIAGNKTWASARVFAFDSASSQITERAAVGSIAGNHFSYTVPPLTATHIVLAANTSAVPAITLQPASQAINVGSVVTFTATASGTPAPTYQWRKNGVSLAGATSSSYTIASVAAGDAGSYDVVITNAAGSITSAAAILTVNTLPAITTPPASQTVGGGYPVTFSVTAGGSPAPTYQWRKNGVNIAGATNGTYTIANAGASDAGTYTVVVTNANGSVTSTGGVLTVRFTTPADKRPTGGQRYLWFMNGTSKSGELALDTISTEWQIAGIGDFNADGKQDILWQNTNTGGRVIWLMNGSALTSVASLPDLPTEWQMAGTGDFNADGKTDILLQNTNTGERYVWLMNGTTLSASISLGVLSVDWRIAGVGDFNGDTKPDILWQNTNTGERMVWMMNGTVHSSTVSLGVVPTEWQIAGAADFNADNKPDILWQNITTGERVVWGMNGTTLSTVTAISTVSPEWQIAGAADFNGDGKPDILWQAYLAPVPFKDFNGDSKADILWQNTTTGERQIWLMNGITPGSVVSLGIVSTDWRLAGSGDFNGDGQADLVWQNLTTGERKVWLMNGTTFITEASLGSISGEWKMDCVGDIDGDGKSDILWQNANTGERYAWLMNGTQLVLGASLGTVALEWQIAGSGDFNGDGKSDILWQNVNTGERYVWLMRGAHQESGVSLGIVALEWQIAGTGDYNNDGKTDILWQNANTGERLIWIMNGTQLTLGVGLGTVTKDWKIVP